MQTIILDLDKTLIHSVYPPNDDGDDGTGLNKDELCGNNGTLLDSGYITFKRPNADRFLRWCFYRYQRVVLWSAGSDDYVRDIVKKMFSEFKFNIVLTRNHCCSKRIKDFSHPVIQELLSKQRIDINGSRKGEGVYFVDDKLYRIQNSQCIKLIEIKPFETKWHSIIKNKRKRKRPIREQDNVLLDIRERLQNY